MASILSRPQCVNDGLQSMEMEVASNSFNLYKTDDLQWHPYTLFHASLNQG